MGFDVQVGLLTYLHNLPLQHTVSTNKDICHSDNFNTNMVTLFFYFICNEYKALNTLIQNGTRHNTE